MFNLSNNVDKCKILYALKSKNNFNTQACKNVDINMKSIYIYVGIRSMQVQTIKNALVIQFRLPLGTK